MNKKIFHTIVFILICSLGYSQVGYRTWYKDADGDSWGNSSDTVWQSYPPAGYVYRGGDCDDRPFYGSNVNPGASEVCDGKDNNCDGIIDNAISQPPNRYILSGPSQLCSNSTGTITLSDSQSGVSYRLYKNNIAFGSAKLGTGNVLSFSGVSNGIYKVIATSGATCGSGSSAEMSNRITISTLAATTISINTSVSDINNICPGTTVTLGTNGSGPNWSGTDNNNTVTSVTLSAGQSKTITVSAKNNCNVTQTATITLKASSAIGTVNISSGLSERCKGGGTTDFNASATNATDYSWSISPNNTAGTINSSGLVTWNANYEGTATITAIASNSCAGSSKSGTRSVTVTGPPLAYALTGPSNLCSGSNGTLNLSDTQSGVSYQLYRNNVVSGASKPGTGNAISWSGVTSGTYKVVASNGLCAGVNMSNQLTIGSISADTVTISASVADINNICPGTAVTLGTNGSGPTWSGSDNNNTVTSVTLSAGQSKTITVSAKNNCNVTQTATITLKASSAIGTVNISSGLSERCKGGGTTDFNASATNATDYSWSISPNNTAGTINSSGLVTWNANYVGTATITATASNNCAGSSKSGTRSVTVTGPPVAYALTGPSNLCSGSNGTLNLSDTQSGVSYQLYRNNVVSGASKPGTGNGISWTGVTSGTYKVVATNGLCTGVEMANEVTIGTAIAESVEINIGVSDDSIICANQQIALSVPSTLDIISWENVDGYITGDNPAYVNLSEGSSRTVSVNFNNACGDFETVSVVLRTREPVGNVTIDSPIYSRCAGAGSNTFTANAVNAASYSWSLTDGAGTISNNGIVEWEPSFYGEAYVTVIANNGCNNTSTTTVRINNIEEKSYFLDVDKDGFSTGDVILSCSNPDPNLYRSEEFIIGSGDCDDEDEYVNPNTVWFLDEDGDGHALAGSSFIGCVPPLLNSYTYESIPEDDCNDKNNLVLGTFTWFLDADNDNAPANTERLVQCESPGVGYRNTPISLNAPIDCNDNDQTIVAGLWYQDVDQDGLGDPDGRVIEQCSQPNLSGGPWVSNKSDFCPDVQDDANLCGANLTPNAGINYVYTRNYQEPRKNDTNFFTEDDGLIQSITYFDGIGRAVQQVGIDQSLTNLGVKNDVITYMEYDDFGRMQKEWLPYVTDIGTIGSLRSNNETAILDFYNTEKYEFTANPYSEKLFDNTPFNRVEKQGAPGNDWQVQEFGDDHSIEFDYLTNASNEVRKFEILSSTTPSLTLAEGAENEFYTVDELVKNIIYDENHIAGKNNSTVEFKDRSGRVLLKRTYADIPALDLNNDGDMLDLGEQAQNEAPHDTYYVYDDFSNLTYVLPPKMEAGVASLNQIVSNLNDLGYQYIYDNRNRLIEKKIPGKGWEYIIYNKLDQPIMTQDANQKNKGEWLFTKYDAFGRIAYSGKAVDSRERGVIQNEVNSLTTNLWVEKSTIQNIGGTALNYNNGAYPVSTLTEVLIVNYYDDYDFDNGVPGLTANSFGVTSTTRTKGLSTGSKIKVLDTDDWITNLTYYNEKGQPIYSYSKNDFLETTDFVTTLLDFTGKPLKVRSVHIRNGDTIVTLDNFTYDALGRLLSQTQCIGDQNLGNTCPTSTNNTVLVNAILDTPTVTENVVASNSITVVPGTNGSTTISGNVRLYIDPNANGSGSDVELIVYNSYDELGKLQAKKVGGNPGTTYENTDGLQTVDYTYNVRGWLKGINNAANLGDDLFAFEMNYNTSEHGGVALFNGNIAETEWKTANDNQLRWYHYAYDPLNRLKVGVDNSGNYNMTTLYDKNGNIMELNRNGHTNDDASTFGPMDRLTYEYDTGNKLLKVSDIGRKQYGFIDGENTDNDYNYDANGNMVSDKNKGIFTNLGDAITYNHLNLPVQIRVFGSPVSGTINYVYDATGVKLNKEVSGTSSGETEYAGNYIYENNKLQFFSTPEGYVEPNTSGGYDYIYQYNDHLGNIRLSYKNVGTTSVDLEIQEENNYYPFGLEHKGHNSVIVGTENNYQTYQGQELNKELGLNWLSFRYRNYDPSFGRFIQADPLSDEFAHQSHYNFAENRVISGLDLEGLEYLDANVARIKVMRGEVLLKTDNMTRTTRRNINTMNNNPQYWTRPNYMGADTRVSSLALSSIQNESAKAVPLATKNGVPISPSEVGKTKVNPPISKSTNRPDRRFKTRTLGGVGARARGAGAALALYNIAIIGLNYLDIYNVEKDKGLTKEHTNDVLPLALADMNSALSEGIIPEEFINDGDLSDILNVVLQGVIDEPSENRNTIRYWEKVSVGVKIYNKYNKVEDE
ncbi:DUF6443 domain-containing protein [Maribacter litoralis]|uniref:DUF6443 domain-containing protein n=1 Tax=Maribacter litoralis TaxID=2059726 RepID=UPI003F5CDA14